MESALLNVVALVCRRLRVEPYLVGGSVRDRLFGRSSKDWDLACRKARQTAASVARKLSARLVILDEQNRIYRVVAAGETQLDFAELQGAAIQQDLARRDFTLNAIACRLGSDRLIDPFNGRKDIRKKILRAVSRHALAADPLRLLRAYRLSAEFKLTIDPTTRRWIHEASAEFRVMSSGLRNRLSHQHSARSTRGVSAERVREEFLRLLCQPEASSALAAMDRAGLLTAIFPDLEAGRRLALAYYGRGGVLKHALESVAALEWILKRMEKRHVCAFPNDVSSQCHSEPKAKNLAPCRKVHGAILRGVYPEHNAARSFAEFTLSKTRRDPLLALRMTMRRAQDDATRGTAPKDLGFIPNTDVLERVAAYCQEPMGGFPRSAFLKLGALMHDIGKPTTAQLVRGRLRFFGHDRAGAELVREILEALRFSRHEIQWIRAWVGNHMRPGNLACAPILTFKAISRFFRDLGQESIGMLLISLGDHYTYLGRSHWGKGRDPLEKTISRMLAGYYLQPETVLPPRIVDGCLLMKRLGLKPGPIIGKLLEEIRDGQAAGRVKTPEQAVAFAQARIRSLAKRTPS